MYSVRFMRDGRVAREIPCATVEQVVGAVRRGLESGANIEIAAVQGGSSGQLAVVPIAVALLEEQRQREMLRRAGF